jgi:hypothetical protein
MFVSFGLQQSPSPWMNQRPLGVDVNVGMCLCHPFVLGMHFVLTLVVGPVLIEESK